MGGKRAAKGKNDQTKISPPHRPHPTNEISQMLNPKVSYLPPENDELDKTKLGIIIRSGVVHIRNAIFGLLLRLECVLLSPRIGNTSQLSVVF